MKILIIISFVFFTCYSAISQTTKTTSIVAETENVKNSKNNSVNDSLFTIREKSKRTPPDTTVISPAFRYDKSRSITPAAMGNDTIITPTIRYYPPSKETR